MINLFAQATATLRIVGLAVVMQSSPGIDVVMPQVPKQIGDKHIEKHVPVLVFPRSALIQPADGWTVETLDEKFSYVRLNGDHIQFGLNADNPPATVPSQLPHLTHGCQEDVMASERGGARTPPLLPGYKRPSYPAAAAVLNIPYGSTSACAGNVDDDAVRGRMDTNVVWNTNGKVVITAKRNNTARELILDGAGPEGNNLLVVAGNVPLSLLEGAEQHKDAGHFLVYYTMLVPEGRNHCTREEIETGVDPCDVKSVLRTVATAQKALPPSGLPEPLVILTPECSNSQYP